jgi:hypothetical protein
MYSTVVCTDATFSAHGTRASHPDTESIHIRDMHTVPERSRPIASHIDGFSALPRRGVRAASSAFSSFISLCTT